MVFLLLYIQQNSHNLTNFVHKLSSFPFPYLMDVQLLTLLLALFWFTSLPFFDCWCRCRCIWILNSEVLEGAELVDNNITLKPLKLMDYSRRRKKYTNNTLLSKPSTIVSIKSIDEIIFFNPTKLCKGSWTVVFSGVKLTRIC